jgi:hypothetical protein
MFKPLLDAARSKGDWIRTADETKYMITSPGQNSAISHNIKTDNNSFERGEEFKYLGKR